MDKTLSSILSLGPCLLCTETKKATGYLGFTSHE